MKLIVGLGNPGTKYAQNRHNLGFLVLDKLAENLQAAPWRLEKKLKAIVTEAELDSQKLLLIKPQTFMNNSGESVRAILNFYKGDVGPNSVWVIHDDIDLEIGELRVKQGGSSGGQNGVQSVIDYVGPDFHRIRIGIGQNDRLAEPAEVYVLKNLSKSELRQILEDTELFAAIKADLLDQ